MKALIIANSILPKYSRFEKHVKEASLILCADGGANQAFAISIKPDFVVGDLDSITTETKSKLQQTQLIHRPSQYITDLEKTLQFAIEKGIKKATIIGTSGGRLDHQICNLNILEKFCDRLEIATIDDSGVGNFVTNELEFEGKIGQQISIFAFRKAEGISTQGLKYPLENSTLEWAVNDGLSNEIIANHVKISVEKGVLFVCRVS